MVRRGHASRHHTRIGALLSALRLRGASRYSQDRGRADVSELDGSCAWRKQRARSGTVVGCCCHTWRRPAGIVHRKFSPNRRGQCGIRELRQLERSHLRRRALDYRHASRRPSCGGVVRIQRNATRARRGLRERTCVRDRGRMRGEQPSYVAAGELQRRFLRHRAHRSDRSCHCHRQPAPARRAIDELGDRAGRVPVVGLWRDRRNVDGALWSWPCSAQRHVGRDSGLKGIHG